MNPISTSMPPLYRAPIEPPRYESPTAPPSYRPATHPTPSAPPSADLSPDKPPSYVESSGDKIKELLANLASTSYRISNRDRATLLRKCFCELFDGVASRFHTFDNTAAALIEARPDASYRLMAAITSFDATAATLFSQLPAVAKSAKPGRESHPVIGQMLGAIEPLERELMHWMSPGNTRNSNNLAVNACVQDIREDLQAVKTAFQHIQNGAMSSDSIDMAGARAAHRCVVL